MQQKLQNTKNLVSEVFDKVHDKYDLMNNLMSFGVHKSWKKQLIYSMKPKTNKKLIDVACGTGDIAQLFLEATKGKSKVQCVDPNKNMIVIGKKKLIPVVGEFVVGDKKPYEYLVKSIKEFVDQEQLLELMKKNKFKKCDYINLNGGIVALHSGWKI